MKIIWFWTKNVKGQGQGHGKDEKRHLAITFEPDKLDTSSLNQIVAKSIAHDMDIVVWKRAITDVALRTSEWGQGHEKR